jgi:hypothetical protein
MVATIGPSFDAEGINEMLDAGVDVFCSIRNTVLWIISQLRDGRRVCGEGTSSCHLDRFAVLRCGYGARPMPGRRRRGAVYSPGRRRLWIIQK